MEINILLLVTIGFIVGVVFWLGLLRRSHAGNLSHRQLILFLFILGLVCRIVLVIGTPDFYAPDEQSHFNYVRFLVEHRSLPIQTSKTEAASNDWEYYQPPLYYMAQVPVYLLSASIFHDRYYVIRALRFTSILLWIGTAWLAWRFLRILKIDDEFLRIVVMSMVCLLPTYTFLSSMINSDNMLLWIGSGLLCLIAREGYLENNLPNPPTLPLLKGGGGGFLSPMNAIIAGTLLGLALLTKLNAVAYCAVIVVFVLWHALGEPLNRRPAVRYLLIVVAVSVLLWLPWVMRNVYVYGSITAESVAMDPFPYPRTMADAVASTLVYMNRSFWSVSGIHNNIHSFFPNVGIIFSVFALFGLLNIALSKEKRNAVFAREVDGKFLGASVLAFLFNALLVLRFGVLYGQGQGRYLYPLLLPISLLIGIGLRRYRIKNFGIHVGSFFMTYAVTFTLFSLGSFPR